MHCPFLSYQANNRLYPCVDGCALKIKGKCAITVLAQAKLAEIEILEQEPTENQTEKP